MSSNNLTVERVSSLSIALTVSCSAVPKNSGLAVARTTRFIVGGAYCAYATYISGCCGSLRAVWLMFPTTPTISRIGWESPINCKRLPSTSWPEKKRLTNA